MTIQRSSLDFGWHAILCVITIALGVAIFFNGIHVQPHQAVGLILTIIGILFLL